MDRHVLRSSDVSNPLNIHQILVTGRGVEGILCHAIVTVQIVTPLYLGLLW